jgi:hypothetical protein
MSMCTVGDSIRRIDDSNKRNAEDLNKLNIIIKAFSKRNQLMDYIYKLTNTTLVVEVTKCSIFGGKYIDFGDERNNAKYEVRFAYYIGEKLFNVFIKDKTCFIMISQAGYNHIQLNYDDIEHQPAIIVFDKLLQGDAINYADLSSDFFPKKDGGPSWEGSGIDKYW